MARLNDREREGFAQLAAGLALLPPAWVAAHEKAAVAFADVLRRELPDLDDVTMARVLLITGSFLASAADDAATTRASNVLLLAAADMTDLERGATL